MAWCQFLLLCSHAESYCTRNQKMGKKHLTGNYCYTQVCAVLPCLAFHFIYVSLSCQVFARDRWRISRAGVKQDNLEAVASCGTVLSTFFPMVTQFGMVVCYPSDPILQGCEIAFQGGREVSILKTSN